MMILVSQVSNDQFLRPHQTQVCRSERVSCWRQAQSSQSVQGCRELLSEFKICWIKFDEKNLRETVIRDFLNSHLWECFYIVPAEAGLRPPSRCHACKSGQWAGWWTLTCWAQDPGSPATSAPDLLSCLRENSEPNWTRWCQWYFCESFENP